MAERQNGKILEVAHLSTDFQTEQGIVQAVRDVSFHLNTGEVLGIVGESGSGKSVTMLSIMGLLSDNGWVREGSVLFDGRELSPVGLAGQELRAYERKMQGIRGNEIGMIFQDPMTYLNPVLRIDKQLMEPLILHKRLSKDEAYKQAIKLMEMVGIPSPERRLRQYPHEFSGGMRQRV
ncbi:MAG: ABC transporter ATP-binding protein, partial [Clostridiales bacterium]|nr:ABC transporter ATP-binding protein [Clostridiales bacterium]